MAETRYELIDKDGKTHGPFETAYAASLWAIREWPDQEQEPDRTGIGWDVQIVGCK